jgi:hypothetical protein
VRIIDAGINGALPAFKAADANVMWIRIVRKPPIASLDGIGLEHFELGATHEVGSAVGNLLLAEGWAEPVTHCQPASVLPFIEARRTASKARTTRANPPNLVRETEPPYFDRLTRLPPAADRDRRRRGSLRLVQPTAKPRD